MILIRRLIVLVRWLLRRRQYEAAMREELEDFIERSVEAKASQGLTLQEAKRLARIELGGVTQTRERVRAALGLARFDGFWLDLRLGARMLLKYPGLTLVSTLALALAIAIVAGFHAGTEFIVRPTLPEPDGDRVVAIWYHDLAESDRGTQTLGDMVAWRQRLRSLEDIGGFVLAERIISTGNGTSRLARAAEISPSAFRMLHAAPLMGRTLVEEDEQPGGPDVALISFDLWQSSFGADPAVVGTGVEVAGVVHTIVGVMPGDFGFPLREQLWTPLRVPASGLDPGDGPRVEFTIGRLASGADIEDAEAEIGLVAAGIAADFPRSHARLSPRVTSYARSFIEANEPELPLLMQGARVLIGIVLLIVTVNIAALVYARNAARVNEVGVRTALGASRGRIAFQMFTEALVLASLAAVLGIAIASWPLDLLRQVFETSVAQGDGTPYWFDVRFGGSTALLVVGMVLASAVLTGVLPALKLTDRRWAGRLTSSASGLRFGSAATFVVVGQVAVSVALLTVGVAQLDRLADGWLSPGDDTLAREEYLVAQLRWDPSASELGSEPPARPVTLRRLAQRVSEEPEVAGVTFTAFQGVGYFESAGLRSPPTYVSEVEPGFFDLFGVSVVSGRPFQATDLVEPGPRIAIVNQEFVRRALSSGSPIGEPLRPIDARSAEPIGEPIRIVGVVEDLLQLEISQAGPGWVAHPTVYVPFISSPDLTRLRLTARIRENPPAFVNRLRTLVSEVDPLLVLQRPETLEQSEQFFMIFVRIYVIGVGFLVVACLLLSTTGVYSMLSFTVSQRTREIGIRMALGAAPMRVVGDVFRRSGWQIGLGTILGLGLGFVATDGPIALSEGIFSGGYGPIVGVAVLIFLTGFIACGRPVRRVLRIQPTEAIRNDG